MAGLVALWLLQLCEARGEQFPSFHAVSILYFNMMCNSVNLYPTDAGQHKILEKGGSRYTLAKAMPHMGFGVSPPLEKILKWRSSEMGFLTF